MDLYATCDKDGHRRAGVYESEPRLDENGRFSGWKKIKAFYDDLQDLPDFPAPGEYKKVKRLSILPLEIEYEEPPFDKIENLISAARTWSANCFSPEEANRYRASDSHLLRAAVSLYDAIGLIEASDEPAVKKPRFDDAVVERVVKYLGQQFDSFFRGAFAHGPKWDQLARDLCTLRDQMNSK